MKQKPKIVVITVNYNNASLTAETLKSFKDIDTGDIDLSLVVVNNGCSEPATAKLIKQFPKVKFLFSKTNLGFAGGNNIGIKYALNNHADYLLLINNDATVESKHFFQKLLKTKGDIISPKVEYLNQGKKIYDYGGKVDYLFGRNYHLNKITKVKPDYFSGVCLLIKTSVFNKLNGLDDRYFLYFEDADFCLKAIKLGYKINYCPSVKIFHHLSVSSNKLGKRKLIILANSHLRFCLRHLPLISAPFYLTFNLYLRFKSLFL
ncbi:MAG TPA: glycosyltransferase family 2 protein [Candidatus Woesebacteria bacterium]|nr:glycosyltransferase family 2 protein [Candidatus Woesebacteria bacterium]